MRETFHGINVYGDDGGGDDDGDGGGGGVGEINVKVVLPMVKEK
jgi:hypothetical protein